MTSQTHDNIRQLLRVLNSSQQVSIERACGHGLLTVESALAVLAEDLGTINSRPGCWGAMHMTDVVQAHGYHAADKLALRDG